MPELLPAALSAGGNLLETGLNIWSTNRQNKLSREFSEKMYDKQFRDSIAFWNMQNAYNTPEAQMQRFENAGLNPHLIYGKGNAGNAPALSIPDVKPAQFNSPDFSGIAKAVPSFLSSFLDMEIKKAQHDNLLADNTTKLEEAELKRAQRLKTTQDTKRSIYDLDFDRSLASVYADAKREQVRKMKADTRYVLDKNERDAAMNAASLIESYERVLSMRASRANTRAERKRILEQIKSIEKDNVLKQLDIDLREMGINPNHPMYIDRKSVV